MSDSVVVAVKQRDLLGLRDKLYVIRAGAVEYNEDIEVYLRKIISNNAEHAESLIENINFILRGG